MLRIHGGSRYGRGGRVHAVDEKALVARDLVPVRRVARSAHAWMIPSLRVGVGERPEGGKAVDDVEPGVASAEVAPERGVSTGRALSALRPEALHGRPFIDDPSGVRAAQADIRDLDVGRIGVRV